ncbi:MAG: hypothetical protein AAFX76_03440 [Planctomycetota bacterium]
MSSEENLYESGLNARDWHRLAYAAMYVGYQEYDRVDIPDRLEKHEIAILIRQAIDNPDDKTLLKRAAKLLVPNSDSPWGIIMKH